MRDDFFYVLSITAIPHIHKQKKNGRSPIKENSHFYILISCLIQLCKPTYIAEILTMWKIRMFREHTICQFEAFCMVRYMNALESI